MLVELNDVERTGSAVRSIWLPLIGYYSIQFSELLYSGRLPGLAVITVLLNFLCVYRRRIRGISPHAEIYFNTSISILYLSLKINSAMSAERYNIYRVPQMLWAGNIMKLALHHYVAIATLAVLLAATGATDQYDPLKQQCFHYSMRCSPLLLTSKYANHQQQYANWAGLSDVHRHVQSNQHLLMASCNVLASEIEGLVDAGGCMVEVTAIAAITDGCLAGVSVFTVSLMKSVFSILK